MAAVHPEHPCDISVASAGSVVNAIAPRSPLGSPLGLLSATVALLCSAAPAVSQQKPTVPSSEYGRFEYLGSPVVAPHGNYLAYAIRRVDETRELRVRPFGEDSTSVVEWGSDPVFSQDGRHLAYAIGVSPDEEERLEKAEEPVRLRAAVRDLDTGEERSFEAVRAFTFDASGRYIALHGYVPEGSEAGSADLRLVDLETGTELSFGNVAEYAWSDVGSHLALTVATGAAEGNGLQVYDAASGRLRSLDTSSSSYRQLAWREEALDLAVLRSAEPAGEDSIEHVLLAWRDVDGEAVRLALDPEAAGVPDTLIVVRHAPPRWSDDGRRIAFGLRPAEAEADSTADEAIADEDADRTEGETEEEAEEEEEAEPDGEDDEDVELPDMQIWHTSDVRVMPQQLAGETADARRTLLAVWTPEDDLVVQVGSDLLEDANVLGDWQHGIEKVSAPYPWGTMFGRPYHDVWVVDLQTGERTVALERVRYSWDSPDGGYLLSFDGADYWSYDLRSGDHTNITSELPAVFADTAYDTPTDLLPPHGVGGWFEDDAAVLLNDRHDVWRVSPDGSGGERLTQGDEEEITHRVVRFDPDDPIDPEEPVYLSLHGRWTEQRGYARVRPGREPEELLLRDRLVTALTRADSTDVYVFRMEARDVLPNLFVSGPDLANERQVTDTSPLAEEYAFGHAELVDFESEAGVRLQGTLIYPANHDPDRRYPMIVYAYEIMTPQTHVFQVPSERSYYNFTAWTQQGYFVFLPDIVFRARDPGVSLVEAMRPAVRTVVDRGLVDGDRVGFIGHSWGGYHAAYLATHTDIFAAIVSGAPLTDFVSFMGQIHWNTGSAEVDHWETGQARMEVPYWEDPEAHHRNSPLHRVHEMTTPLLMAHGSEDGVVEFFQATVFYNFARRAGKQMVLLVYEEEDHGFQKEANQVDYHRRILEWFGHYLRDEPAQTWITEGVRLEDIEAEKRRVAQPEEDVDAPDVAGGRERTP